MFSRRIFALLALWLSAPAIAQRSPALDIQLSPAGSQAAGPTISASRMLDDAHIQELLRSGFPAAMHFHAELWRTGGMLDNIESTATWDVYVRYDPYSQQYFVRRRRGAAIENFGGFSTLAEAQTVVEKPYPLHLNPAQPGHRYYYDAILEVESLSVSDLEELQGWLRGDVRPAVQGHGNPFSAIKNGVGRLLSRVLGGKKSSYEQRSPIFVAE